MKLRVTLAQLNPTIGDFEGNVRKAFEAIDFAEENESDIVVFPELFITGYPPEDLVLRTSFLKANLTALEKVVEYTTGKHVTVIIGFIDTADDAYNSAAVIKNGLIVAKYYKQLLPNYSVFDEQRYFKAGDKGLVLTFGSVKVGVNICEDIWSPIGPVSEEVFGGKAQVIINLSASPYFSGKPQLRREYLTKKAYDHHCAIVYVNTVGGQDEIVFDGGSLVIDPAGNIFAQGKAFEEDIFTVDIDVEESLRSVLHDPRRREFEHRIDKSKVMNVDIGSLRKKAKQIPETKFERELESEEELFEALKLALKDYVRKNGFKKVILGLSGGVDSALVATIAKESLGAENVRVLLMPSQFSSESSVTDAIKLAENLGIKYDIVPITKVFESYLNFLEPVFEGKPFDITEENLQARIRGNYLMAMSNKFNYLVLTTGNKSEIATGYSTLYGDSAGGFALIKDLYKVDVYRICRWYNKKHGEVIPENILTKAPSAELRPNQKDQDTLPPYEILDEVLKLYIEEEYSIEEVVEKGFDRKMVEYVARLVKINEYKRRQMPIGPKLTKRGFGKDRRMPITNRFFE